MENPSVYDLAQQYIEQRQRKRDHALFWLVLAALSLLSTFAFAGCLLPLLPIALIFAALSYNEFTARQWIPPTPQVDQEMEWLFGENWADTADVYEYALALERIRKRRIARSRFVFHLIVFLLVASGFLIVIFSFVLVRRTYSGMAEPPLLLLIPLIAWIAMLVYHRNRVFPTQRRLAQRERQAGEAIQRELDQMQPVKLKNEEKLKRDTYYTVGDDGELIEVDSAIFENKNPESDNFTDN
ncbi:MAG: 2TM domain-containing protein [Anaerolineae bacterium]|nr:2TM domain-containing protein [Anaerolineae bacterium]